MKGEQGERRSLGAIMFTDMVGYSSISRRDESLVLQLLEEHRSIRSLLPIYNGTEIKTMGDTFLVEFASAEESVKCACEIQQSLHKLNGSRPPEKQTFVRIGVHLGDVIHKLGDIYGNAVNVASRIEPLAEKEGVCISGEVYAQVRNKIGFPLVSIGSREFKNVQTPIEVYKVVLPWEKLEPHSKP
ncbi:MAG: adenylate/guanylate cyclase domain-containing protein [Nitrososphaerales archaeon]